MKKRRLALAMAFAMTFTSVYTGGLVSAEDVVASEGATEATAVAAEEAQSVAVEETPAAEIQAPTEALAETLDEEETAASAETTESETITEDTTAEEEILKEEIATESNEQVIGELAEGAVPMEVSDISGEDDGSSEDTLTYDSEPEEVYQDSDRSCVLRMYASTTLDTEVTYEWYKDDNGDEKPDADEKIVDETGDTYTIGPVTYATTYICQVSDGNRTGSRCFHVHVNNGFNAWSEEGDCYFTVNYGDSQRMAVEIPEDYTGEVSYQWQRYIDGTYQNLEGEGTTAKEYTATDLREDTKFRCVVKDDVGNRENVDFEITVATFALDNKNTYYHVAPGTKVTLKVPVTKLSDAVQLTYTWYRPGEEEDIVLDETGDTYTTDGVTSSGRYYCTVSGGNFERTKYFYINIESGLTVRDNGSMDTIELGASKTLWIDATTDIGEVHYQWYRGEYGMLDDNWTKMEYTESSYFYTAEKVPENDNKADSFRCVVSDDYGNSEEVIFVIWVSADTLTVKNYQQTYKMKNGTATLTMQAESTLGEDALKYQWYSIDMEEEEDEEYTGDPLEGETGKTLTVENVTGHAKYKCEVTDDNEEGCTYFDVYADSGLKVTYDENSFLVQPGADQILSVTATPSEKVTYQWKQWDEEYYEWLNIEGANGATYQAENILRNSYYKCIVTDEAGYSVEVRFEIKIKDTITLDYDSAPTVNLGEEKTLAVTATSSYDDAQWTYQWYQWVTCYNYEDDEEYEYEEYRELDDATSSSYQIPEVTEFGKYKCEVSDGVNKKVAYIQLAVQSGFSYTVESPTIISLRPGEKVDLTVSATSTKGEVSYQWYQRWGDDDSYDELQEENENVLTVYAPVGYKQANYGCKISDGYNEAFVSFDVMMQGSLQVTTEKKMITVPAGQSLQLTVSADTEDASGSIHYEWQKGNLYDEGGRIIVGTDSPTYKTEKIRETSIYYCEISDKYTKQIVMFLVTPLGGFDDAKKISLDQMAEITATEAGEESWVCFTPQESGYYGIYCQEDSGNRMEMFLYDELNANVIYGASDNISDSFLGVYGCASCNMLAGHTYYIMTRYGSENQTGTYKIGVQNINEYSGGEENNHQVHSWIQDKVLEQPACERNGKCRFICIVCGETQEGIIPANGKHVWDAGKITKTATCVEKGIRTYTCTICGETKTEAIPATGKHTYGAWKVTKAATALAKGVQTRSCSGCGHKETKDIAKLPAKMTLSATSVSLKRKQSTTALKVTGMATGDYLKTVKVKNGNYATVSNFNKNGTFKLTAKNKVGSTTLTITLASGKTGTVTVKVQKAKVATSSIKGVAKTLTLAKGKTATLKPSLVPITSQDKITYSSSNKKVATVSAKGVIKGVKAGKAKITVKAGKKSVTCTVIVTGVKTTKITGVKASATIKKGKTLKLNAKVTPKNSDEKITYSSSNKKVATVSAKGVVKGVKKGTAVITVKSGSKKVTCKVTVK